MRQSCSCTRAGVLMMACVVAALAFAPASVLASEPPTITVTAVGDVCFASGSVSHVSPTAPFAKVRPLLSAADVTVGNLETPLSKRGRAVAGKTYTFRSSPKMTAGLSWAGFDLLALGNNHTRDYGPAALRDTVRYLDAAGLAHAGAGVNRTAAFRPAIIERNGARIAFLSFSQIGPANFSATSTSPGTAFTMSASQVKRAIAAAHGQADYVIVSFHWGVEESYKPTSSQVRFGRAAVDAGADLVLSHHPHVIQGVEFYRGKLIAYSLGNFVFAPPSAARHDTMILSLTLTPDGPTAVTARPVHIDGRGRPSVATGSTARRIDSIIVKTSRGRGTRATVRSGVVELAPR